MNDSKMKDLISKLTELTRSQKILWQSSRLLNTLGSYQYSFPDHSIVVEDWGSLRLSLQLIDKNGAIVTSVEAKDPSVTSGDVDRADMSRELRNLLAAIKQQPTPGDEAVSAILAQLQKIA